jgi:DNA-binding response OmpR family regulator
LPQLGAARLLIVDDDPELRHFLRTELELEGYACTEAATGQQALMQVWDGRGDLLLLDWTLPDFSGVELCRRLRRNGAENGAEGEAPQPLRLASRWHSPARNLNCCC